MANIASQHQHNSAPRKIPVLTFAHSIDIYLRQPTEAQAAADRPRRCRRDVRARIRNADGHSGSPVGRCKVLYSLPSGPSSIRPPTLTLRNAFG
ncbi:hypothetical protein HBI56_008780 [Parastagonospora nodorum]|uniref:Uncharacterized protein n=1 Tax=Phaeosphaeria nodorum (strain SN15 / ATCC MYA-4574 / FGSC 10173) TaxID=321614 RepID=A0A7U2HU86_PHANO|nr:hypothetical protein HBH56_236230 [Parastagonospora nodorum]QRC90943.1 hypothetical protein JI435_400760 [Parastagonospora nodorum SN15]KAH3935152.1 hypothetical protein HBH54_046490 [Parastagonospora nodorum]KAH3950139.1 hypothetical protein HBH53_077470 [Parastagonospora nodorum]KAH3987173.1 hypothetical protein HBH51_010530 [Parastagonospora nodorum]